MFVPLWLVATVLTVYGIETAERITLSIANVEGVATVLTVYGIETAERITLSIANVEGVATVLTVYGIETSHSLYLMKGVGSLQQSLPFTVLKRLSN